MRERGSEHQEKRKIVFEAGGGICKGDKIRFYSGIFPIKNG